MNERIRLEHQNWIRVEWKWEVSDSESFNSRRIYKNGKEKIVIRLTRTNYSSISDSTPIIIRNVIEEKKGMEGVLSSSDPFLS